MNFNDMVSEDHKMLCDKLKIPHDWVKVKITNWTRVQYVEWLDSVPQNKCKFLQVEFDHHTETVKYAEYLVAPQYASIAQR